SFREQNGFQRKSGFDNWWSRRHWKSIGEDVPRKRVKEAYKECENTLGVVDILINNAAILSKDLRKVTEVIQFGTMNGTEIARKKMGKHNGGKGGFVMNIASILGVIPDPMFPFYAAAKAAIVHYTRIVGNKVHRNYSDVSVLCLCPGPVEAPLLSLDLAKRTAYDEHIISLLESFHKQPISKLQPKEIGDVVVKMINENKSGEVAVIDNK
ncbi:Alcohol dehydrogenase 2, partial [Armadillidium nasatum]